MSKVYYMHTLDGHPAEFIPGQGLCFMMFYGRAGVLCRSLKEIRQQQRKDIRMRGFGAFVRSHRRVRLP